MGILEELSTSLRSGFIDSNLASFQQYNPRLLINDFKRGMKVLSNIENELSKCEEFNFSVAFITNSGVTSLINILSELDKKNIKGRIITSQYQNFTEPIALKRLLQFKNIELRIVTEGNFHAKGYIFKKSDSYSFIIGSSNLTQSALSLNKEWNVKLSSLENGALIQNILKEFEYTFDNATVVDQEWIKQYSAIYTAVRQVQKKIANEIEIREDNVLNLKKINPNQMQKDALKSLEVLRNNDESRALIISATGTGKTYLSAFDVAKFQPRKFLFVVHRENIARAAMRSYKAILGYNINAGLLTGTTASYDKDYTFATVQTISKEDKMEHFPQDYFDYIVIDEVHRAGANSYQRLLEYFKPKFLLGMSATPERTDGYDIFSRFNYNIAYEIRLNRAMEENMLSPFHYFGVSEIQIDGEILDDNAGFNKLVCKERVDRIIEAAHFYGWDSGRVKGLIFCSRKEEARELSEEFNFRGYSTIALVGESSENLREESINRLEQDKIENKLDYIFTVDVFNEGVDIPTVNQIIMLRPTQSAIIFVQQLGRGLRKSGGKEFLTVIDFIGNYANNYLIPIALYGDRSFNKDTVRKIVNSGSSIIPGCSTVQFDEITKKRIFESIDNANLSKLTDLRKDYELLKYELGRIPTMMDFFKHGSRDPYSFIDYKNSYYNFVVKVEDDLKLCLNDSEAKLLEFYSKEVLNAKRLDEAVLLLLLINKNKVSFGELNNILFDNFKYTITNNTAIGIINILNGSFLKEADTKKYGIKENIIITEENDEYWFVMSVEHSKLINEGSLGFYINDTINYSINKYKSIYNFANFRNGFLLYEKYSRKEVCRILNWDKDESSTIYGYRIKHNTCPIFVTYHKGENITGSTKYNDTFINNTCFSWMTRNKVTLDSPEVKKIKDYKKLGLRISLFIKKSDGEGTDFYYMGDVYPIDTVQTIITGDNGKELPIVNIKFGMIDEVEESIYQYLES
jgi:superfamily II DNA or RNA helicase/HKD family nuclease